MLIGPADIIAKSWKTLRDNVRLYGEFVIWYVVLGIVQWTVTIIIQTSIPEKTLRILTISLSELPISLAYIVLSVGIFVATAAILQGKKITFHEALLKSLHELLHYAWVGFLFILILLGGMVLLVVPAIIFYVWYRFGTTFVIVDGLRGTDALKKSRALVKGRWWPTFFRIILPNLFFYVTVVFILAILYLVIGAAFGNPGLFFGNTTAAQNLPVSLQLVSTVVSQTINGFSVVLFVAAELLLWFSLKENPTT